MKLTKAIREAFIRSVMNDVPTVDYDEQASKLVQDALDTFWVGNIGSLADREKMIQHECISRIYYYLPHPLRGTHHYGPSNYRWVEKQPALYEKVCAIAKASQAQIHKRQELQEKIEGVANSVTTRKALAAALPEFEKYLPEDAPAAVRSLPVVQNVVADFVKAGWPKAKVAA